ncbi:T9SS type A sorting domain-containing protein [Flavobacterium eburneipallidum]|uniref:rhamnogalacturonan lyase family protein n=1 Tax=Flavobacterium eburneipallidum TaxID=3003263 RepID=UPI002482B7F4|nr:T9SS type A sorting domain-containing protein [Flavobacterium eburneipallidum]
MKKQLLFESVSSGFRKTLFRITLVVILSFCTSSSTFAQNWNLLGSESEVSAVASTYTSIAVLNDVPYVVLREGTGPVVKVKKRNATTGVWEQFGNDIGTNLTYSRIVLDKINQFYVTYVDAGNGNKLAVKKYNSETDTWEPLNNDVNNLYVSTGNVNPTINGGFSSSPRCSLTFDSDNNPYIAYGDNATLIPFVKKFDGNTWVTIGSGPVNASLNAIGVSLVLDEADVPWLVFCNISNFASLPNNGTMTLYTFNSGTWTPATTSSVTAGVRHTSMVLNSANNLSIAFFNIGDGNRATSVVYNKTAATWSSTTRIGSRDSPSLSLIKDVSNNLYCSFIDNVSSTATYSARVFKQIAGATTWTEMKDPSVTTTGIENNTGNLTIALGSEYPYVVYTKTNSASISTPVVRKYAPAPPPAVITTNAVTNITSTTVDAGGDITSDGGTAIIERGVVYGLGNNPTIANTKVIASTAGIGNYTVSIPGLTPATMYYVRAYAINGGGTSTTYGSNVRVNTLALPDAVVTTPKQVEFLNRGVVALRKSSNEVFVSWRLLGNDPATIAFNIYRDNIKINTTPITASTNYIDNITTNGTYSIKTLINGTEGTATTPVSVWANNQLSIPLQIPPGGTIPDGTAYTYSANDASVGDVDGDGEYEIILKWDPSALNHNGGGYSGDAIFDCYKLNGTRLWRINLGKNMNAGPHFNPFMVYDFDGDGKAEIILKTADGTIDGVGTVIGNATVDYRNTGGWVQQGPEFLTVFNGLTGAAMATVPYQPARANTIDWGDNYGNRQDRFVSAVAYLDGARPSIVVGRGYYDKLMRAAYDWRNGQLTLRWIFDSKDATNPGNNALSSQGNHQMTIGDVDGDGKDEIINGSSAINDDGKRLWTYGQGHGDALHMSDMDPDRPGQEIWQCLESEGQYSPYGIRLNDAKTGKMIFGAVTTGDVGRALAADVDPNHRGYEMWSSAGNFYNVQDGLIGTAKPTGGSQAVNSAVWWDGDLGRELLDGTIMDKWNPTTKTLGRLFTIYNAAPVASNNDTKKNQALTGDILGDWREEILLRRADNTALILFTTNIITDKRIYTLMHDPQYRTAIAWQNSAYNQPPHPSFFLGYDMAPAPVPNVVIQDSSNLGINKPTISVTSDVMVYPNPSAGQFTVELNGYQSDKASIAVSNINGQVVLQKEVALNEGKQTFALNIPNNAAGVYLLKVTSKDGVKTMKLVLEK